MSRMHDCGLTDLLDEWKIEYKEDEELMRRWLKMFLRVAVATECLKEKDLPTDYFGDLTEKERRWEL